MSYTNQHVAKGEGITRPPFYYTIDPELRIVHLFHDCSGLKMAKKWGYKKDLRLKTTEDGKKLDTLGRPCHTCWKKEQYFCKKYGRKPRPGFLAEPRA